MTKRIQTVEPTVTRIQPSETTIRAIDAGAVAKALGGEPCLEQLVGRLGPITLFALRSELVRRRQSGGGRTGIESADLRAKIPMAEQDWARLETIAASLSTEG